MIYIVCFMVSTAFVWLASRAKDRTTAFVFSAASVLVLCVLGGLRDISIGIDTSGYAMISYDVAEKSLSFTEFLDKSLHSEIGFSFITYIISKTLGYFNWMLFVCQLITVSCAYVGLWKHRDKFSLPFAWMVWSLLFYNTSYNLIRQFMAVSVVFMELDKLEEGQYLKFLAAVVIASLFHTSAFLALGLVVLHLLATSDKMSGQLKMTVLVSLAVTMLFTRPLLAFASKSVLSRYSFYFMESNAHYVETNTRRMVTTFMAAEFLMLCFYGRKAARLFKPSYNTEKTARDDKSNINFFRLNIVFCIIYQLAVHFYVHRILVYSEFANVILLSSVPSFVSEKHFRFLLKMTILSACMFYWWWIFALGNYSGTYPYKSIL